MRITNKIMQRNSLANINSNKELQDKLTNQMSTQKKISRASDDPVVAIRALRLRSNVTEVSQYYSKNIPDAESWLSVTESALKNSSDIIKSMIEQVTKGANGDLTSDDRQIILEQLKSLSSEVYATGDASYAGRYVFAGYRTDTALSFKNQSVNTTYSITEQITKSEIDSVSHVNLGELANWTNANYDTGAVAAVDETQIAQSTCYRIRLSYKDVDGALPSIEYYDETGAVQTITTTGVELSTDTTTYSPDPYSYVQDNPGEVILLRDTGELLLGKNAYDKLMGTKDNPTTSLVNEAEIRVIYDKTQFAATDLRPEHFFACTATTWEVDAAGNNTTTAEKVIDYNQDYLKNYLEKQSIEYDVGFNQTIRVNTTADEAFDLGIGREITDLINALRDVTTLEDLKADIEKKLTLTNDNGEIKILNNQLSATEKALTYAKDNMQKRFEQGISALQGYLDSTSLAITNNGTRSSKLELIKGRMQNQKTTFETLKSENEDIDITEVAIQLSSAELTYEAALTATGKIVKNTLLQYI